MFLFDRKFNIVDMVGMGISAMAFEQLDFLGWFAIFAGFIVVSIIGESVSRKLREA